MFSDHAARYLNHLEECLTSGPDNASFPDANQFFVDEDAIFARAVYGTEFSDRLWGLTESGYKRPSLDPEGACLIKDAGIRLFGGGISRISSSAEISISNPNNSCLLSNDEISCYRRMIDHDASFQQMLLNRDRALRSCIQSIRIQPECHRGDLSHIRSCICNAREDLEHRMQGLLLSCTQDSSVARLYSALVDLSSNSNPGQQQLAGQQLEEYRTAPSRKQSSNERVFERKEQKPEPAPTDASTFPGSVISPGVILNGQCLCSCAPSAAQTTAAVHSFSEAADNAPQRPTAATDSYTRPTVAASNDFAVGRRPSQTGPLLTQPHAFAQPVQDAATSAWRAAYRQPLSTLESAQEGISDGFGRFFNGMPPIRRRDVSHRTRTHRTSFYDPVGRH
ncbi:Protein R07B1.8 [Aphelenchoides avenae]|nr:Protein R07B1.8 [Aphelenchus avenae]